MRYFVTGATGFIGGKLTERLIKDGHEVSALVRNPKRAKHLEELGVDIHIGDITDQESIYGPMEGVDGVFHVAGWYKVGAKDSSNAEDINVQGTMHVLHAMHELNIPKGVYTSTLTVFSDTKGDRKDEDYFYRGKHLSEYDHTKWEAHYSVAKPLILNQELPLVIVMPGIVYGSGDTSSMGRLFDDYLKGNLGTIAKDSSYCWAHVDDIVEAHILAMEKGNPGETYIIAGPPHTMVEAFDVAENITGIKAPKRHLSPGTLRFMSKVMGFFNTFLDLSERYHPETLRVAAGVTYLGNNEKAKKELGYDPRDLENGFKEHLPKRLEDIKSQK